MRAKSRQVLLFSTAAVALVTAGWFLIEASIQVRWTVLFEMTCPIHLVNVKWSKPEAKVGLTLLTTSITDIFLGGCSNGNEAGFFLSCLDLF